MAVGSDADLVIWDGGASRLLSARTQQQRGGVSVFEGQRVHGAAEWVISRGRVCVEEGQIRAVQAAGRFLPTPAFPPEVYLRVRQRDRTRLPQPVDRSGADDVTDAGDVTDGDPVTPPAVTHTDTAASVTDTAVSVADDRRRHEQLSPCTGGVGGYGGMPGGWGVAGLLILICSIDDRRNNRLTL